MGEDYDDDIYVVNQFAAAPGTTFSTVFPARADRCALLLSGTQGDTVTYQFVGQGSSAPIALNTTTGSLVLTREAFKHLLDLPVQAKTGLAGTIIGAIEVYPGEA